MKSNDFYSDNSEDGIPIKKVALKKSTLSLEEKNINNQKKLELKKHKEILKQQSMQEKNKLKVLKNENKTLKPGECLKHILVMIDQHLKEIELFDKLDSVLEQSDINHDYVSQPIPCMITFSRSVISMVHEEDGQNNLKTSSKEYLQENMLLYIPTEDFFTMINAFKLKKEGDCDNNIDIESFIILCEKTLGENVQLSFVIIGLQNFLKNLKMKSHHSLHNNSERILSKNIIKGDPIKISFYDIEEIMLHMQLHFRLQAYFHENTDDFMKFLLNFTKAIAEKPFKQSKLNQKDGRLCELMKSSKGMKLNAEVDGCSKIWLQQLQQFKNVSIDVANAIVDVYPAPLHLIQAYQSCENGDQKEHLLEDINIRRGAGITSTNRKIGSVLSKKISLFFNSTDGNEETI